MHTLDETTIDRAARFDERWADCARLAAIDRAIATLYNELPSGTKYPAHNEAFSATIGWLEDVAGELREERTSRLGGTYE